MHRDQAYGLAGLAHAEAANPDAPDQERRHRKQAIDKLSRAVELSNPGDAEGWRWRFELAQQLAKAADAEQDTSLRESQRSRAVKMAQEALTGNAPETKKNDLHALLKTLMR